MTTTSRTLNGDSYRSMAKEIQNILRSEMEVAAENGKGEAQAIVALGTGTTWKTPPGFPGAGGRRMQPNPAGRIDSGAMLRDVAAEVRTGRTVQTRVGWVHNYQDYYGAQDKGFSAPGFRNANQEVEGMGMIAHLRTYMRDQTDMAVDRALRRVNYGL